jgi:hypothetical protein
VAVFNPPRGLEEGSRIFEQFFGFLSKKTSAIESSSHAPSRASGRLSRGAVHFLATRSVGWMEEKVAHLTSNQTVRVDMDIDTGVR